jgi:hypothetical protein
VKARIQTTAGPIKKYFVRSVRVFDGAAFGSAS